MEIELNKIYCMDCLEGMKHLEDNSVDLVVTDPPYNLNKGFDNDNLLEEDYVSFLVPCLNEIGRISKAKNPIIIFFDSGKNLKLFWLSFLKTKLHFQRHCTLYKQNDCSYPHNRTLRTSEAFLIVSKTPELSSEGEKYIHDCLISNYGFMERWSHPSAKPIGIIREIILAHSIANNTVLDPFMGSGTTALACKQLNRNFIGFEINQEYVDIANRRLAQETLKSGGWLDGK